MQLSPLQLLEYTFDGVSVMPVDGYVADPEFSTGLVFFPGKLAMSADTGLTLLTEEVSYSDFGVRLTLRVGPKEDSLAPYQIQVAVRGVVRMHLTQDAGQEERRVRALVNGVSLLYGVVREMVTNITARSAHGQMLLPSLNFADLATQKPDAAAVAQPILEKALPKLRKATVTKVKRKA
ncbi:protein-export chaperone SecB [Polaromonas sp. P1-6]|nr:protein-export chaperone SecB [Polaromonas sp. P1-6]